MRQDPPFDLGYITATHLLERIARPDAGGQRPGAACATRPKRCSCSITRASCRRRWWTRSLDEVRAFLPTHGEIVVKPLHGNGGKAIFKVGADGANLSALIELFDRSGREPHHGPGLPPRGGRRATSASCWSTAKSRARSTACRARASSAPTSRSAARPRRPTLTAARGGNLRRARARAEARAACCSSAST